MVITITTSSCQFCGTKIKGRADKRFCNDRCRNAYHNQQKTIFNATRKRINAILKKNRYILEKQLLPSLETTKTTKERLIQMGFHFTHHTHQYNNPAGTTYFFCYDLGYMYLQNDLYLIVRRKPQ